MIYILTGPVRTGKTTVLLNWVSQRQDVDGVLCPDGGGRRYFLLIKSRQKFDLEAKDSDKDEDTVSVGWFRFLKSAFTKANDYLVSVAGKRQYTWLIIDELGKLELKNTGLHRAAKTVIKQHEAHETLHAVLVVRDTLLEEILRHYNIKQFELITREALDSLK